MSSASHSSRRIAIVGGGVAGLSAAVRLAQSGLPVTLFEAGTIGHAASTRNQGWLHSGGWFAPRDAALARLCHQSLEQTIRFCPDCLEPGAKTMVYAFSQPDANAGEWKAAWDQAGIPCERLDVATWLDAVPALDRSSVQQAFRLPDRSIRWDILLERLAATAEHAGAEIRTQTPITQVVIKDGNATGVETGTGEVVSARLVILAGNAAGASLWPSGGEAPPGEQSEFTRVALKSHLLAIKPEVLLEPFCIVDAEGFNHLPHLQSSIFGTSTWQVVGHALDQQPDPVQMARLWSQIGRFFPRLDRNRYEVIEWAGTTIQALHVEQVEPGAAPYPTVIDHARDAPRVGNLLSVFTGRATLWAELAELTRTAVLDRVENPVPQSARPPWEIAV